MDPTAPHFVDPMAGQVDTSSKLKDAIDKIPLIDSHAHTLPQSYESSPDFPRETLVSLADGEALKDSVYSLAHIRMTRHLSRFFSLPPDSSWQAVLETAKARDYASLCGDLIKAAGIQAILIDDGIQNDHCHPISWHDQLTSTPNKRIVQIEALFESIVAQSGRTAAFFDFPAAVRKLVSDPDVVGFNSSAAYRSGLDVQPLNPEELALKCELAYGEARDYPPGRFRVEQPQVAGWLVNATCSAISGKGKPIQFHTGLGDSNTTFTKSDAMLLQPLMKAYPRVPFVLLHSGYLYARQAGYLATVHSNVYLDFGGVIPLLSGDGQRNLMRQVLEICPTNKLLWSSSTVFYPERFYLGALQTREALNEILTDYVRRDEIGLDEAVQVAKRMLFENANKLYKLNIECFEPDLRKTATVEDKTSEKISDKVTGEDVTSSEANTYHVNPSMPSESSKLLEPELSLSEVSAASRVQVTSGKFLSTLIANLKSRDIMFVRVVWVDYVNVTRYHEVSMELFIGLLGSQLDLPLLSYPSEHLTKSTLSVTQAALGMQINDEITPSVSPSGHHDLKPDLSTIWIPPFAKGHAYLMGRFFHKANAGGKELETCPRTILQQVIRKAERELAVKFLVGFQTGFVLLQPGSPVPIGVESPSKLQRSSLDDCVNEIVRNISDVGIKLNTHNVKSISHSRAVEIIASPLPPMQAVDALVVTRDIIHCTARKHSFRATCVSGSHTSQVHIFVQSASSGIHSNHPDVPSLPKDLGSFMAGLLTHLGSVCMFTVPLDACYSYVRDNPLNASLWACWSIKNMEAPIRLCSSEQGDFSVVVRMFDGTANPPLGLAAILGAGLIGLRSRDELKMRDYCNMLPQRKTTRVFAIAPNTTTKFIDSWLPEKAWKLYQDVRNHERSRFYPLNSSTNAATHSWKNY